MRPILLVLFFLFSVITNAAFADSKEIPYTMDDRDRMIRVEENQKAMRKEMDDKFNSLQVMIYFVLGGMISLIGFVLWDRRSTSFSFKGRSFCPIV